MQTLLVRDTCTINELAEAVDINPISVRHHITRLQVEGLVDSSEARHGVGRPRRIYFLTDLGRERFPQRYIRLTLLLLQQLKETMPQPMVDQLFTRLAQDLARDHQSELDGLTIEEKLDLVTELLSHEGFMVNWDQSDHEFKIQELSCPYYHIGQDHPEICSLDQTIISTILNIPAQRIMCKLDGDSHCTYIIPKSQILEVQEA